MKDIGQIKLVESDGSEVVLASFPFTIGSFKNVCSLTIDSRDISPIHCQIVQKDSGYAVEDLNSKLGVEVNGLLIDPNTDYEISNGDVIKIGDKKYTFTLHDELLSEDEFVSLNGNFKKIIENPVGEISLAERMIELLLNKALEINKVAFGEERQKFEEILKVSLPELTIEEKSEEKPEIKDFFSPEEPFSPASVGFENTDEINITQEPEIKKEPNSRMIEIDPNLFDNSFSGLGASKPKEPAVSKPKEPEAPKSRGPKGHKNRRIVLREQAPPYTVIKVTSTPFKIGRSSQLCDFVLDRRGVSRSHATVMRDEHNKGFIIRDNNSVNGTFVNDHQLTGNESVLNLGDVVKFYDYEFKVIQVD